MTSNKTIRLILIVAFACSSSLAISDQSTSTTDDRPPRKGRAKWYAQQAKNRGEYVLTLPSAIYDYDGGNMDLPDTLHYYDVLITEVVSSHVIARDADIATWYRVRMLETLHRRATSSTRDIDIPPDLPGLSSGELWAISPGGKMVVDDVQLRSPLQSPLTVGSKYLFFAVPTASGVALTAGGPQGLFLIGDNGNLSSVAGKTRLALAIETSANGNLQLLREVIRRIEQSSL